MDKKTITIIIPIFNEEKNIPVLFGRLEKVRNTIQNLKFRYLFINDGSNDKSFDILTEISLNNSSVSVISFTRNFGHQNALSCGLEHSDSDYIVTIDSDLQDPPELIIEMYNLITNDYIKFIHLKNNLKNKNLSIIYEGWIINKILFHLKYLKIILRFIKIFIYLYYEIINKSYLRKKIFRSKKKLFYLTLHFYVLHLIIIIIRIDFMATNLIILKIFIFYPKIYYFQKRELL